MAKKKTTEKALNIDNILFNCRDYLRAARNSGSFFEKRDMMLTLVFLRFIGEKYEDGIENLKQTLKEQGLDPEDENIRAAFFDDATFADGTYNLPPEARWSTIISTPAPQLNVALTFLLAYGKQPLLLDQPEDDLDNRLVYDLIVARLKVAKSKRQIIVVTHNANIPVNGDSEYIISMNSDTDIIQVNKTGTMDDTEIRQEICDVMEGTKDAFEMRAKKYHFNISE